MPRIESIVIHQGPQGAKGDPSLTVGPNTLALGSGQYPKGDGTNVVAGDFAADVPAAIGLTTTPNTVLMPDGTSWGMFAGSPVLMSNWSQDKIPTDGTTPAATKLNAFLARAASLKMGAVLLPGYTYIAEATLNGVTNLRLYGHGATIKFTEPSSSTAAVLALSGVTDVVAEGLTIDGNKAAFAGATQWRHGIAVSNVQGLTLRDLKLTNCKGDGLCFNDVSGGTWHNSRAHIENVIADGNYRQGCSIIDLADAHFVSCVFRNTSGTAPQAGLDIEPNYATSVAKNLRFTACDFTGNAGAGVNSVVKDVTQCGWHFDRCAMTGNAQGGVNLISFNDATFADCFVTDNTTFGYAASGGGAGLTVRGGAVLRNTQRGLNLVLSGAVSLSDVLIEGVKIQDNGQEAAATYDGIRADGGSGTITNLRIRNCDINGSSQRYALTTSASVSGLRLVDNDLTGNGTGVVILGDAAASRSVRGNRGYTTSAGGTASVANGGTIVHGLVATPTRYSVTPTVAGRRIAVTAASSGALTISLQDASGANVTVAENVVWSAEV